MDLSTLKFDRVTQDNRKDNSKQYENYEIPWRSNEIEAFRNFLMGAKRRLSQTTTDVKNLCVIRGQTGSGKVSAVRTMCRDMKIKLVEYDPFNTVVNTDREFDYTVDHLVRFLQSALSRKSLRTRMVPLGTSSVSEKVVVGGRGVKRIRRTVTSPNNRNKTDSAEVEPNEDGSQLILICDLPRGILNCRYMHLYPLQSILRDAIFSDDCHPLAIVSTNSNDDNLILRRILPTNYAKFSNTLILNLREVNKSKIMSMLKLDKKNKLLDHLVNISGGDLRYIANNAAFYHRVNVTQIDRSSQKDEVEVIKEYLLERNNENNFNLLRKILFNTRVPVRIVGNHMSNGDGIGHASQDSDHIEHPFVRFRHCFDLSKPINNEPLGFENGVKLESSRQVEKGSTHLHKVPLKVRMYGITEEFDPNGPLDYSKWPKLEPEEEGVNFRLSSSKLLPKVTRPQLFHNPDQLIDSIKTDPSFFASSIFDNYTDLFGHIDDCASMARHFVAADVFLSSHRSLHDMEVTRHFLTICLRGAADSNIHGFDAHKGAFHSFVTHSSSKTKSDQIRSLFHDFKAESRSSGVANAYSRSVLFLEIIPMLSMVSTNQKDEWVGDRTQTSTTDEDYSIVDVMDKVEKMLEKGLDQAKSMVGMTKQPTIFTPKFNEILQELGRHYNTQDSDRTEDTEGGG